MRTLVLAALTMVTAFGVSAADAQRLGGAGASYPVPGRQMGPRTGQPFVQQPGGGVPVVLPPPPRVNAPPARAYPQQRRYPQPAQSYPQAQPYPQQQSYPQQRPYPQQGAYPRPGTRPDFGGGSNAGGGSRWGGSVGGRWSGGSYAPGGWNAYRRPSRGYRVPSYWISPSFYIGDYGSYGLSTPPQGYSWHRYYDDAVLIDQRGKVWDSTGGLDWDGAGYGGAAYGGSGGYSSDYGYADGGAGYPQPQVQYAPQYQTLPPVTQAGGVTTYQTGYAGYGGGTTTVVTIQPTETVTTTTTEYIETSYVAPRRVYRAKKHYRRPVVRHACGCGCCR